MPDERAARRGDFEEGVPIALADGQEWHFRRPRMELYPAIGPDGSVEPAVSFGPAYHALVEALEAAPTGIDQVGALMKLAVFLLRLNYDLAPADYRTLLPFRADDPANEAMWVAIAGIATGTAGPKPSAVG